MTAYFISNYCYDDFILFMLPAGMFCSQSGQSQPTGLCEAGYYCPAGSTSPNSTEYQVMLVLCDAGQ